MKMTNPTPPHGGAHPQGRMRALVLMVAAVLALLAAAPAAEAAFGITAFDAEVTANEAGDAYTQAGGHPFEASTSIDFNSHIGDVGFPEPDEDVKTIRVDLPPGLIGNPQALPLCEPVDFFAGGFPSSDCPVKTQIGVANIRTMVGDTPVPLFSLRPATDDVPAAFGFGLTGARVVLEATVGPAPDYAVTVTVRNISQGLPIIGSDLIIWGTPADPSHDAWRCKAPPVNGCTADPVQNPDQAPQSVEGVVERRPFLSLPTGCTAAGVGVETVLSSESWQSQGSWHTASVFSHLPPGYPATPDQWGPQHGPDGCERVPFEPSASVRPTTQAADSPTGLEVDMRFAQGAGLSDPGAISAAHLRSASVVLPEGMSINPAAADGLQACTDDQLGRFDKQPAGCPEGSKIGTVTAVTPILDEALTGEVFVGSQNSSDPGSGEMFRMLMALRGPGVVVKLAGQVKANPATGQLVATFDNNPQFPVSSIAVRLKDGPRAPLATPPTCGIKSVGIDLTSWADHAVNLTDSFTIPCPANQTFSPSFDAGTTSPTGGSFSPFVAQIDRPAGQQFLSGVSVDMPKGLIAKLRGVELCPDAVAGDGTPGSCPAGSRIGTATVGAGAGSPFYLAGDVYLTGPYNGGPYGLSVQVPAKAGPFDLGMVKVRQAIRVDPITAELSVISDPLPQIVKGVPTRLRSVNVDVDRPGFTINPTSCSEKQVTARFTSTQGASSTAARRFQAGDCQALGFKPKMAMSLSGRKQTRTGGHPTFKTVLTQGMGQANIGAVKVTMPRSIALDAQNSYDPKLVCDYDRSLKADCPASTVIGNATAHTPVLNKPLTGAVHLVQGINFGPNGNRIRTTPSLLVKLRGEVAIDLRGKTTTEKGTNRLVTTFPAVPDAPVSKFTLKVNGGSKGILTVTRTRRSKINLCSASQTANVETDGQNGKRADYNTKVKTPCANASKAKARKAKQQQRRKTKR